MLVIVSPYYSQMEGGKKPTISLNQLICVRVSKNEITEEDIYALCATFWVTLGAADTQHIHRTTTTSEKASIIEAVSVNAPIESLWCSQREFHAVFVASLRHYN